jgi:hypothetical protein
MKTRVLHRFDLCFEGSFVFFITTNTAFSWFSSLSPNSIDSWDQLEHKFHDHFYSPKNELKFLDLTLVRQSCDESVNNYIRRFRDTKNPCFNLMISKKRYG